MTNMNYPVARKHHSMAPLCRVVGAIIMIGSLLWHAAAHAYQPSAWVSFDGNMRVEVSDGHELTHSSFTVASWVRFDDNTGRQIILNRGGAAKLFTFYLFDGQLRMLVQYGTHVYDKAIDSPAPAVGVWTHVAGTYDGASIKLYVNGVLADTVAAAGSVPASNEPVIIGAQNSTERFLKGRLQDVAYWKSVVSGADILALAQGTKTPSQVNASDLLSLWQASGFVSTAGLWRNTVNNNSKYWGYVFAQPATYGTIDTGYRGIWSSANFTFDEYVYKYSGGLGTYPAKHKPFAHYSSSQQKTYFVWGGTTETSNTALVHMISYYDHSTGKVPKPTRIWNKGTNDAHDNPVMTIDNTGTIWVFSTAHGISRPSYIHRSTQPYNIREFEPVDATYLDDDGVTRLPLNNFSYFQVWYRSGSGFIAFFTKYERITGVGTRRTICFMTSADGVSWSKIQKIGTIEEGHYQVSAMDDGSNTFGTAFNYHPDGLPIPGLDARANVYYVQTSDMGQTWQNAQGQTVTLPLTTVQSSALVVDTENPDNRLAYMKDLRYDQNGRPVIVYLSSGGWEPGPTNAPRTWHTARWNGGSWEVRNAFNSDHNYDAGSLYIRNGGSWETVAPTTSRVSSHNTGGEMVLWRSTNNGSTWTEQQQLTSGSEREHTYARQPVNVNDDFYAFWADGDARATEQCGKGSSLYFHDRQANKVYRLPRAMTQSSIAPEEVTAVPDINFFTDNFGDGVADNWTVLDGAWTVQNGQYAQSAETGFGIATRGDDTWTNYVLEADVKHTGSGTRSVGLIVRYQDPCNYYFAIYERAAPSSPPGVWRFYKRVNGVNTQLDQSGTTSWPADTFNRVKVTVDDDRFIVKHEGATVLDVTDSALATGKIALRTSKNSGAFDNVSVQPLPPLFSDDFQDGNALGWSAVAGIWSMLNTAGNWQYTQITTASYGISVNGNAAWSDYILEADVKHTGTGTRSVGLIVRYQDASNYYFAIYERAQSLWRLYRRVNGGNTLLATSAPKSWPADTYHRIKVDVKGNRFIVIDDGTTVINTTDGSLATGKIGLRTYQNTGAFDNVLVLPN